VSALLAEVCEGARLVHALGRQQTFVLPVQNVDVAHLFNTLERQKLRRCVQQDPPRHVDACVPDARLQVRRERVGNLSVVAGGGFHQGRYGE